MAVATDEQWNEFGEKWAAMAITEPVPVLIRSITAKAVLMVTNGPQWIKNIVTCADRAEAAVIWQL